MQLRPMLMLFIVQAYWRHDVLGVMIISILCLGDGMADVMGR
jgi:hypothetical protein